MGIKRQSPGKWQVFSETGVGAGYKLHTYIPGTTDDKATYQDKDAAASNTNPVVFDARGEADIWYKGSYDLRLVDSNDVLIWTISDFGEGEDQVNYGNYNLVNDGGFEDDTNGDGLPDQWSVTAYPTAGAGAGVIVIDTTDHIEGAQSLKFTSVGDGGGYAVSSFFNVREAGQIAAAWMMKSTSAGVRNVVEVIWYTAAKVQISTSSLYDDSATNPTNWTQKSGSVTAVTNARFAKLRIYGCHSSDATTGDTWFDAVQVVSDTIFGDLTIVNDMTVGNDLTVTGSATIDGRNIATDGTKLDAIEANADVTDTANVTAAGALMDSEVDADIKTLVLPASTTISAFGRILIDDAAASNARATLGLGGLAIVSSVNQSTIDANSVGQSEIKTTYQEVSLSIPSSGTNLIYFTPSGGVFTLGSTFRSSLIIAGGIIGLVQERKDQNTTNVSEWLLSGADAGVSSFTAYARLYYITASRPYDLGDGEVGLFIFALIDNATGKVEAVSSATEAPWHYNGKTDVRGKLGKDGKKYRKRRDMSSISFTLESAKNDPAKLAEYSAAFNAAPMVDELITQEIYQRDMIDIPHPFLGNDLTGKTVVMLDPVSDLNHELALMVSEQDEFDLNGLLHDGQLIIGNSDIGRVSPAGVLVPSFKWKNTK